MGGVTDADWIRDVLVSAEDEAEVCVGTTEWVTDQTSMYVVEMPAEGLVDEILMFDRESVSMTDAVEDARGQKHVLVTLFDEYVPLLKPEARQ